ncbi:MAG: FUSC family protein [Waddliaceae bacterium]
MANDFDAPAEKHSLYEEILNRVEFKLAIKTGIAASLSLILGVKFAQTLEHPNALISGTWCVLSTFVVLQAHLGGTYQKAWERFLGTLTGSFMGALFTSLFGTTPLALGIGIVLTIITLSLFNLKDSIRIACLSVSVVTILRGLNPEVSAWTFGLFRFLDSTLGILIAVVVAHMIWPSEASDKIRFQFSKTLRSLNRQLRMVTKHPPQKNFDRLYQRLNQQIKLQIQHTKEFLAMSRMEILAKSRSIQGWQDLINRLQNIFDDFSALSVFHQYEIHKIFDKKLSSAVDDCIETASQSIRVIEKMLKMQENPEAFPDLQNAIDFLNEELNHFRTTRVEKKFQKTEVEQFFVFFYHLRSAMEQLRIIMEEVAGLNNDPK